MTGGTTLEDALKEQAAQLRMWKMVLAPLPYQKLMAEVGRRNIKCGPGAFPSEVWRGEDIFNWVRVTYIFPLVKGKK